VGDVVRVLPNGLRLSRGAETGRRRVLPVS